MLVIPKGKLNLTRVLVWIGAAVIVGGLVAVVWLGQAAVIIILAGGAIYTVGAYIKQDLYRCPKCGEKLLVSFGFTTFNVLFERCPGYCLNCSTEIKVKKE